MRHALNLVKHSIDDNLGKLTYLGCTVGRAESLILIFCGSSSIGRKEINQILTSRPW